MVTRLKKIVIEDILPVTIITALCIYVHQTAISTGWISDDFFWKAFFTYTPSQILQLIISQHNGDIDLVYFRPLAVLSHQIEFIFYGDNALGYHITNLAIHTLSAILLFALCKTIKFPVLSAFIAALLFAIYPAHSEAVTWISGRADVLCLFLILSMLLSWCKARITGRNIWYILSGIFYVLAMLSKEHGIVGILFLPLIDMCLPVKSRKPYIIYISLAIVVFLFRLWVFNGIGGNHDVNGQSLYIKSLSLTYVQNSVLAFISVFLAPVSRIVWNRSSNTGHDILILAYYTMLIHLVIGLVQKKHRIQVIFAIAWIVIMFLPTMPLLPVEQTFIRTRFMYASSCGLAMLLGLGFSNLISGKSNTWRTLSVLGLILLIFTSSVLLHYQDILWKESSVLSENINYVITENTKDMGNEGTVILINIPSGGAYNEIECIPLIVASYFKCLYGFENTKVLYIVKPYDQIDEWWNELQKRRNRAKVFVFHGMNEIQYLE